MADITVNAIMGPHFKGSESELKIICHEVVASALHSPQRPVLPGDVRVLVIDGNDGELRHDVLIYVSDPEGKEKKHPAQVTKLKAGLRQAFDDVLAGLTVATRFRVSITSKSHALAPRGLFGFDSPALNMSLDAAISRIRQRIMLTKPLDPENIEAGLDQLEDSLLDKVGSGNYAGQLQGD